MRGTVLMVLLVLVVLGSVMSPATAKQTETVSVSEAEKA